MELNTRQWEVYRLLTRKNGISMTEREICNSLNLLFPEYEYEDEISFHDSKARQILTKDIQVINNSDIIQKVIMSNPTGIFILTDSDYKLHLEKEEIKILSMLKRLWKKKDKIGMNNQTRLVFGNERDCINSLGGRLNA